MKKVLFTILMACSIGFLLMGCSSQSGYVVTVPEPIHVPTVGPYESTPGVDVPCVTKRNCEKRHM
jgi:hypothetical protein